MGYSISLTLIHRPETGRRRGPAPGPRGATGGRRHLGHPRGRRQPRWLRDGTPGPARAAHRRGRSRPASDAVPSIGIDNRAIGRLATAHMLAGGARRVGHRDRAAGLVGGASSAWRDGVRRSSPRACSPSDELVFEGDWSPSSGERRALPAARAGYRTSTPCSRATTRWRSACCTRAHRLGPRIPDELSVVGWTTSPRARISGRR